MGCYDSVMVLCPKCGEESEFQSKSGDCLLKFYKLDDCPIDVIFDINKHAPNTCEKCGTKFYVEFKTYKPDDKTISIKDVKIIEFKEEKEDNK